MLNLDPARPERGPLMARCCVVSGVPEALEDNAFTYKQGEKKGQEASSLRFRLRHDLTELVGGCSCETFKDEVAAKVRVAFDAGESIVCVAEPRSVRWEKDGEIADFVTLRVRAVAG